jgi:hypothetical protein
MQLKKKFYFKKEKEFEFILELNTEDDLFLVKCAIERVSGCRVI